MPPQPLADIGEDLSAFIHSRLKEGASEINRLCAELPQRIKVLKAEEQERRLSTQAGQLEYLFKKYMFYRNLFHDVSFGGVTYRRIIEVDQHGNLTLNRHPENDPRVLMKRFISEHLDESLNPNVPERLQRAPARRAIRDRCVSWLAFYGDPSKKQLAVTADRTKLWFGYDYGRRGESAILPHEECF